jgi:dTDP-4-dehydrorhamnose reductase
MKNNAIKVLITGGFGQLASALKQQQLADTFQLFPYTSQALDITQAIQIEHIVKQIQPDVIINAAAYTAVDQAEDEKQKALQVNCDGVKNLAQAAAKHQIPLVHISTDYIFDGKSNTPYRENDLANPINHYGKSKWLGEQAIREYCENHIILRVSGVFSEFGHNFLKSILRLAKERESLRIVADQTTCPTYASDIANVIYALITKSMRGTYHYCSQTPTTWHEFATAIIEQAKHTHTLAVKEIIPIAAADYATKAIRPMYSVLDSSNCCHALGITQSHWQNGISRALAGIKT